MKTATEILQEHCPVFDPLFMDREVMEMHDRILSAMEEYRSLPIEQEQKWHVAQKLEQEIERLKKAVTHFQASRDEMDAINRELNQEVERLKEELERYRTLYKRSSITVSELEAQLKEVKDALIQIRIVCNEESDISSFKEYFLSKINKALESSPEQPEQAVQMISNTQMENWQDKCRQEKEQPEAQKEEQNNLTEIEVANFICAAERVYHYDGKFKMMDFILDHKTIQITRKNS